MTKCHFLCKLLVYTSVYSKCLLTNIKNSLRQIKCEKWNYKINWTDTRKLFIRQPKQTENIRKLNVVNSWWSHEYETLDGTHKMFLMHTYSKITLSCRKLFSGTRPQWYACVLGSFFSTVKFCTLIHSSRRSSWTCSGSTEGNCNEEKLGSYKQTDFTLNMLQREAQHFILFYLAKSHQTLSPVVNVFQTKTD